MIKEKEQNNTFEGRKGILDLNLEESIDWFREEIIEDLLKEDLRDKKELNRKKILIPNKNKKNNVLNNEEENSIKDKNKNNKNIKENTEKSRFIRYNELIPGSMYSYFYDPKYKDTLPYYDAFPLVFIIDIKGSSFTGLNLHYLRPALRLRLFEELKKHLNNKKYDETTRIAISYSLLKRASRLSLFKPCFKKYLGNHIISKIKFIHPVEWNKTILLPTEQFVKNSKSNVWRFSEIMI